MPFAGYKDFADCVSKNSDKDDPEAYCGTIQAKTENWPLKQKPQETLENILIREKIRPFAASFFAAEPGISENHREYSEEVLRKASPGYPGKPFIMDHDYQNSRAVQGRILRANYETRYSPYTKQNHQGLWLDGVGLMDEDLYQKMQGDAKKGIPPLIRGVSIGGDGQGERTDHGTVKVTNFRPMELSGTAFPGIPAAHVSVLADLFNESIKASKSKDSIDLTGQNLRASAKDISLNQGIGNMPTMAEAVQDVAATIPDNKIQERVPRSPTRRVSMDGRTVAFPAGVKASAPAYNELTAQKAAETASVKFNPPQVPEIVADPPQPQPGILPPHPTGITVEPNAELLKQIEDQKQQLEKVQAELQAYKNKEQGPTRGLASPLSAGPYDAPGGLPPASNLTAGGDQPTPMTGSAWLNPPADSAAGTPEFDRTVHSQNPNLHPIQTNQNFAPRADSPTTPSGIMQRYGHDTKESRQPQERQLVDTRTVAGNAVPQPVMQQSGNQRYHARVENVMQVSAKHLEIVRKQRPDLSLNEQIREAWFRSMNETTGKTRTPNKGVA